jgi:hypothetical protein
LSVPALHRWRSFPDHLAELPPATTRTSAPAAAPTIPPIPSRAARAERSESRAQP